MPDAVPMGAVVCRAPEVHTAHDDVVRIEGVHRNGEIIESLPAQIGATHGVAEEIGHVRELREGVTTVRTEEHTIEALRAGLGGHDPDFPRCSG